MKPESCRWRSVFVLTLVGFLTAVSAAFGAAETERKYSTREEWQESLKRADDTIDKAEKAIRGTDPIARRQAVLELQSDPIAVQRLNLREGAEAEAIRKSVNAEVSDIRTQTKENIKNDYVAKWNADHPEQQIKASDVEIVEPTNRKAPSAKSKVSQDWDVTVRVNGKDVPVKEIESIVNKSYYDAAGGKGTFGNATAKQVADQQHVETTDKYHPESYKDPERLGVMGKEADFKHYTDGQDFADVMDAKGRNALKIDGAAGEYEQFRQASKQYDNIVSKTVEAHGRKVPTKVQEGMQVMKDVAEMKISPAEGRERLAAMGETPESMTKKAGDLMEAVEKLDPNRKTNLEERKKQDDEAKKKAEAEAKKKAKADAPETSGGKPKTWETDPIPKDWKKGDPVDQTSSTTKKSTPAAETSSTTKKSTPAAETSSTTKKSTPAAETSSTTKKSIPAAETASTTKKSTPAAETSSTTKKSTPAAETSSTTKKSTPAAETSSTTKKSTPAAETSSATKKTTPAAETASTTKKSTPAAETSSTTKKSTPAAETSSTTKKSTPAAETSSTTKKTTPAAETSGGKPKTWNPDPIPEGWKKGDPVDQKPSDVTTKKSTPAAETSSTTKKTTPAAETSGGKPKTWNPDPIPEGWKKGDPVDPMPSGVTTKKSAPAAETPTTTKKTATTVDVPGGKVGKVVGKTIDVAGDVANVIGYGSDLNKISEGYITGDNEKIKEGVIELGKDVAVDVAPAVVGAVAGAQATHAGLAAGLTTAEAAAAGSAAKVAAAGSAGTILALGVVAVQAGKAASENVAAKAEYEMETEGLNAKYGVGEQRATIFTDLYKARSEAFRDENGNISPEDQERLKKECNELATRYVLGDDKAKATVEAEYDKVGKAVPEATSMDRTFGEAVKAYWEDTKDAVVNAGKTTVDQAKDTASFVKTAFTGKYDGELKPGEAEAEKDQQQRLKDKLKEYGVTDDIADKISKDAYGEDKDASHEAHEFINQITERIIEKRKQAEEEAAAKAAEERKKAEEEAAAKAAEERKQAEAEEAAKAAEKAEAEKEAKEESEKEADEGSEDAEGREDAETEETAKGTEDREDAESEKEADEGSEEVEGREEAGTEEVGSEETANDAEDREEADGDSEESDEAQSLREAEGGELPPAGDVTSVAEGPEGGSLGGFTKDLEVERTGETVSDNAFANLTTAEREQEGWNQQVETSSRIAREEGATAAQEIGRKSAAETAAAQDANSWGDAIADGIEQGVSAGLVAAGTSFGGALGDEIGQRAANSLFGDPNHKDHGGGQSHGGGESVSSGGGGAPVASGGDSGHTITVTQVADANGNPVGEDSTASGEEGSTSSGEKTASSWQKGKCVECGKEQSVNKDGLCLRCVGISVAKDATQATIDGVRKAIDDGVENAKKILGGAGNSGTTISASSGSATGE